MTDGDVSRVHTENINSLDDDIPMHEELNNIYNEEYAEQVARNDQRRTESVERHADINGSPEEERKGQARHVFVNDDVAVLLGNESNSQIVQQPLLEHSFSSDSSEIASARLFQMFPQFSQWLQTQTRRPNLRQESDVGTNTRGVIRHEEEQVIDNLSLNDLPRSSRQQPSRNNARNLNMPHLSSPSRLVEIIVNDNNMLMENASTRRSDTNLENVIETTSFAQLPTSDASGSSEAVASDVEQNVSQDEQTTLEDLYTLIGRCNHFLPFAVLFLVYFVYLHISGIMVFVIGTVAIMGLDQRIRAQIALKERASLLHLSGIIVMCIIDTFAICCMDGDPNPFSHFAKMTKIGNKSDGALWDVLWVIIVNGT